MSRDIERGERFEVPERHAWITAAEISTLEPVELPSCSGEFHPLLFSDDAIKGTLGKQFQSTLQYHANQRGVFDLASMPPSTGSAVLEYEVIKR